MKPTSFPLSAAVFSAAVLFSASTLNAGSQPLEPKVAALTEPDPFSWTGFYIGGNLGGTWNHYDFSSFTDEIDIDQVENEFFGGPVVATNGGPVTNTLFEGFGFASFTFPSSGSNGSNGGFDASDDGLVGGGQLGFNKQWGHFVFGVEGDFQRTSTTSTHSFSGSATNSTFFGLPDTSGPGIPVFGAFAVTDLTAERSAETNWQASARARLGYATGPVLFYVTGGAAWADVKVSVKDTATTEFFQIIGGIDEKMGTNGIFPFPGIIFPVGSSTYSNFSSAHETVLGWTGGGGGEWAVNEMVSIGVQYLHSDYGSHTYHFSDNGGPIFPSDINVKLQNDQVTLRFNILFSKFFGH